jgi:hypothetical protein
MLAQVENTEAVIVDNFCKDVRTNIFRFVLCRRSNTFQDSSVSLVISMRKVETGHIHTGINQSFELFLLPTGRPNSTNNLGVAQARVLGFVSDHGHVNGPARKQGDITSIGDRHFERR